MKKKKKSREIRVGLFILAALAIMISAVFFIGGQRSLFGEKVRYRILFDTTAGLYEGDPVLLTGVEIGNVIRVGFPKNIELQKIEVEISVGKEAASRIRKNTRARIASASLVYGKVVELTMGNPSEPAIESNGVIETESMTSYSAIVDSTGLMVQDIRRVLSRIDGGEGMVSTLINEPLQVRQTLNHLHDASLRLASALERLDRGEGTLGFLLSGSDDSRKTVNDLKDVVNGLKAVSENLKGKTTTLGRLVNDEAYSRALLEDLRSAVHSLASVAAKIDTGSGTLGSLINDPELYVGLQDVVMGAEKSSLTKWMIQNRRKAGEKERLKSKNEE